jgi:endonuclease/exonuclease/phosphatase family metal-dependent hydrolase
VVVDVEKDGRSWRVGCVHLMPRLLNDPASVDLGEARNGSWAEIAQAAREQGRTLLQVLSAARDSGASRPNSIENSNTWRNAEYLNSGEPFDVVAGDWNNQPYGHVVGDVIEAGYVDPFASSDRPTFGLGLRAMRIDQVLVRAEHGVRSASVVDPGGSDHAALVVEFGAR